MTIPLLRKAKRSSLQGTALVRLDFNTKDDWRMEAVLPTIKFLLKTGCKIVIVSHRGRPQGGRMAQGVPQGFAPELHLRKDAAHLSKLLKRSVAFVGHFRFAEIARVIAAAPRGSVFMLDNLRFMEGEETNSEQFAKQLASLADFYVNDAFAVSHRANASVSAITKFLPGYAGFELEREIASLSKALKAPKHPLVLVLGGAKASDKLGVIRYFRKRADAFLLGGGSANSVLAYRGVDVKQSLREEDPSAQPMLRSLARERSVIAPTDFVWHGDTILDIGPETRKLFAKTLAKARTIIWTGPMGEIEKKRFAQGSIAIANAIGRNRGAFSLTGGGETVMFLRKHHLQSKFSFVSTGGGAMVDFLAGKALPGIKALARAPRHKK